MGNVCQTEQRDFSMEDSYFVQKGAFHSNQREATPNLNSSIKNFENNPKVSNFEQVEAQEVIEARVPSSSREFKPSKAEPTDSLNMIANGALSTDLPPFAPLYGNGESVDNAQLADTIYKYKDDSTYQGNLDESGNRTGFGVSVTKDGDVYKGDWKNNKPNGLGRFVRFNGDYY